MGHGRAQIRKGAQADDDDIRAGKGGIYIKIYGTAYLN